MFIYCLLFSWIQCLVSVLSHSRKLKSTMVISKYLSISGVRSPTTRLIIDYPLSWPRAILSHSSLDSYVHTYSESQTGMMRIMSHSDINESEWSAILGKFEVVYQWHAVRGSSPFCRCWLKPAKESTYSKIKARNRSTRSSRGDILKWWACPLPPGRPSEGQAWGLY